MAKVRTRTLKALAGHWQSMGITKGNLQAAKRGSDARKKAARALRVMKDNGWFKRKG